MKTIRAKFPRRESEFTTISERIEEKMDNNPGFPDPPPALAELKKTRPAFQTARKEAKSGDREKVAIKNKLKAIMLNSLIELADYVTVTSKGDRTLILSSGFDATSESSNGYDLPPSIEILDVVLGGPGTATTRIKNVTGAKGYIHQYTKEPPGINTEWIGMGSSEGIYTFEGLSSEKRYWFRVVAIGYNRQTGFSPVVSVVIQ
ncbi:fibronectin type III domain-containing protein [Longitalea luteola]|uniref:fibronectin type III domain-containing protein n=1 Tax=Longitalea luteola TaxID=2812563 RepID=UPI001A97201D|nr:fibronectin type III domain-containing protein [Longitalea luteola]